MSGITRRTSICYKDTAQAFTYDLGNLDRSAWMARVDDVAEEFGYAEPVGPDHTALLVSFESVAGICKHNDDAAPLGWALCKVTAGLASR